MYNQKENSAQLQEDVISDYCDDLKQLEIKGYQSGVRRARTVLFVAGGLVFVSQAIWIAMSGVNFTSVLLAIAFVESAIFVVLGFWTRKKPYTAIMMGLILFVGLWILSIAESGFAGAISGIIVRVIIISYLISALKPAKAWEEAKNDQA